MPRVEGIRGKENRGIRIAPVSPERLMNAVEAERIASPDERADKLWIGAYAYFLDLIEGISSCAMGMAMIVAKFFGGCSGKHRLTCENAGEKALLWQVSYPRC